MAAVIPDVVAGQPAAVVVVEVAAARSAAAAEEVAAAAAVAGRAKRFAGADLVERIAAVSEAAA